MNFWIIRNHIKQANAIISFLKSINSNTVIQFNQRTRQSHTIHVYCGSINFVLTRLGRDWYLHLGSMGYKKLPTFGTDSFWEELICVYL
jgi:hypothetical protein